MEENINKQETIMDTANTKETKERNKKPKNGIRIKLVVVFLLIFMAVSYVQLRGSYLEYLELGEEYLNVFYTNMIYRYSIMVINFVVLYLIIYFTNRGIKKGLKVFFDKENKPMPKLLNKSLALIISAIVSFIISTVLMKQIMLVMNSTAFGIQDNIFNLDIAYYVFQKPLIEAITLYFTILFVGLSIYMALYYVIIFNRFFDGIDGKMLKQSLFMKKLTRNILFVMVGVAIMTVLNVQNMMFGKLLTINEEYDIVGAGMTETTVKLWGYIIFAFIIVIFSYRALRYFKQENTSKVLKNLAVIPGYLVVLFFAMMIFDITIVGSNELDKEKDYLAENIKNTKNAYGVNIEEANIENSGTITNEEVEKNSNVINNIPIISKEAVLNTLEDSQTETRIFFF